jgi:antitoxin component YwqK of YwqJK toxin-antitoxin module
MHLRNGKTINESLIGYKKARDNHLVILEIPFWAKHNIHRTDVKDKQFAKHRCSEAFVKDIVNLNTGESVNEAYSFHKYDFKYVKGQKVIPDTFANDLNNVCGGGIHFFLDKHRAEKYEYYNKIISNGEFKVWCDNGQLHCQGFYKDGELEGELKGWFESGKLHRQQFYQNGKLEGESKVWYANGQLFSQSFFKGGNLDGEHKKWLENGQLFQQCFYKDGKLDGEFKEWHEDGKLYRQCFFKNGEFREWL